jgi:hypothetical protein
MTDRPNPVFQTTGEVLLIGTMATYNSQAEASQGIPQQWRLFLVDHPALEEQLKLLRCVALHWRPQDSLPYRRCTWKPGKCGGW